MPSIEYSVDTRDIAFVLFEQLKIQDNLLKLGPYQDFDQESFEVAVEEAAKFTVQELGPINREGDLIEAKFEDGNVTLPDSFKEAYRRLRESGWVGLHCNPELGGQGFPELFGSIFTELSAGANTSFALVLLLNNGTSHLIEAFGTEEQKELYCNKIYSGEWGGTMCLTEPQSGSDLGTITTTATPEGDHYLIEGTKIFITNGEQDLTDNIAHAVLARTPGAPAGTKGISLFLVPKYLVDEDGSLGERNDVVCDRIEHKLGIKASPTCVMNFGSEGKCKGWLLGQENRGMAHMFQMMNEARLGVGVQGLANAAAAYMSALGYAQDRRQGAAPNYDRSSPQRSRILDHPDVRRMLLSMKAYVEGLRALLYNTAVYVDMAKHHEDEGERARYQNLVELLTPVCKAYGSDMGFRVCETAVQTFGGYGFTQEYPVEQYLRDAKIASIYEGTNGIQALDLFFRKIGQNQGLRLKEFGAMVASKLSEWKAHPLAEEVGKLGKAMKAFEETSTELLTSVAKGDVGHGFLNATPYLEMFGNFVSAYYLTEGAICAYDKLQGLFESEGCGDDDAKKALLKDNQEAAFYHSKIQTAKFFNRQILTKNLSIAAAIDTLDTSPMEAIFLDELTLEN